MKKAGRIALLAVLCVLLAPRGAEPCSSFVLQTEGGLLFATNYDNEFRSGLLFINRRGVQKTGFEPGTAGEVASWTAEHGSVTISVVGSQFGWSGMNEAGLVVSTMILGGTEYPPDDERPPLLSPMWVQYVLDTCATVEEVIATKEHLRITDTHDHYLVGDRTGASAAIEFLEGKMVAHTRDTMPVPVLTNSKYARCLRKFESGVTGEPDSYDSVAHFRPDMPRELVLSLLAHVEAFAVGAEKR